jgi:hypothetical protein
VFTEPLPSNEYTRHNIIRGCICLATENVAKETKNKQISKSNYFKKSGHGDEENILATAWNQTSVVPQSELPCS